MDNMDKLRALAWEARRRGVQYGQLVGQLTAWEVEEVCCRWQRSRAAKTRRKDKKKHPPL